MSLIRATVIAKMRGAIREGVSASAFIRTMRDAGMSYRRTDMLSDWRSVTGVERVDGVARYVRKDYYPTAAVYASVDWKLSKEFMYKVKVQSRVSPTEPITERMVNVMSDNPLTPREIEEQVQDWYGVTESLPPELLVSLSVWTAVRKVME